MKRFIGVFSAFILGFILSISITTVEASEKAYVLWSNQPVEFDLDDNVRTITFSQLVNKTSLQGNNGNKLITLWDVTNPNNKKQLELDLTIQPNANNKVDVRLAEGAYENGHLYSLFIEQDIQSASSSKPLKNAIQYDFKMVSKESALSFMPKNIGGKTVSYEIVENGYGGITFKPAIEEFKNGTHTITLIDTYDPTTVWKYTETANQFVLDYDGASVIVNYPIVVGNQTQSTGKVTRYNGEDWATTEVTAVNTVKAVNVTMELNRVSYDNVLYIEQQRSDTSTPIQIYFTKDSGLLAVKEPWYQYRYPRVTDN